MQENVRFELFRDGKEFATLNYFENAAGMTNITIEDDKYCASNEKQSKKGPCKTNNYVEQRCRQISRLLERVSGDSMSETRLYKDIKLLGASPDYRESQLGGEKGLIFEKKMSRKNGIYKGHIMVEGYGKDTIHCTLDNEREDTNVEVGIMSKKWNWRTNRYNIRELSEKINLAITPNTNAENDYNIKFSYNNNRVFDGWFVWTRLIRKYARKSIPLIIDRQLETFQGIYAEYVKYISEYVK